MLKFLTHKLRTHSINENNFGEKENDDHDSGTESDDEIDTCQLPGTGMEQRISSVSPADTGCSMESPAPDGQDAHSSEEELEVINNSKEERISRPLRSASSLPEKRKWSQIGDSYSRICSPENEENISHFGNMSVSYGDDARVEHSSDDEVNNLLASMATPVQFRTSPPLEAVKPGGRTPNNRIRSMSPPPKLLHYEVSPRKRSRHTRHVHVQRPYLDFEKMQQRPSSLYTITSYSRDSLHSNAETREEHGECVCLEREFALSTINEDMLSDKQVASRTKRNSSKTPSIDSNDKTKTPVYIHEYCKYGNESYKPQNFSNYFDERAEYLSNKFNNLTLANSMSKKGGKPCKPDCPLHSKSSSAPKCLNAKVDHAVIKQLEETYWAKWKPNQSSTTRDSPSKDTITPMRSAATDTRGSRKFNRHIRTEEDCKLKATCEKCVMLDKCKDCLKYIQRDKDFLCLHKKDILSETDSSELEANKVTSSIQEEDEDNFSFSSEVEDDLNAEKERKHSIILKSKENQTSNTHQKKLSKQSEKKRPTETSIKSQASYSPDRKSQGTGTNKGGAVQIKSQGDTAAKSCPQCAACCDEPTKDNYNRKYLTVNQPLLTNISQPLSELSKEEEMTLHHFERKSADRKDYSSARSGDSEYSTNGDDICCTCGGSDSKKLDELKKELSKTLKPCKEDCSAVCKAVIENEILPLKHTDSYILNVKRSANEKPHYPQPTSIKLSNTSTVRNQNVTSAAGDVTNVSLHNKDSLAEVHVSDIRKSIVSTGNAMHGGNSNENTISNSKRNSNESANPNTNVNANANSNAYPNANTNAYPNANTNAYPNANTNAYPNANTNGYPNANTNAYPNVNTNAYPNVSTNAYSNAYVNANAINVNAKPNFNQNIPTMVANANINLNGNMYAKRNTNESSNTYDKVKANSNANASPNVPRQFIAKKGHSYPLKPILRKRPVSSAAGKRKF